MTDYPIVLLDAMAEVIDDENLARRREQARQRARRR
jgi:hypothetical protein